MLNLETMALVSGLVNVIIFSLWFVTRRMNVRLSGENERLTNQQILLVTFQFQEEAPVSMAKSRERTVQMYCLGELGQETAVDNAVLELGKKYGKVHVISVSHKALGKATFPVAKKS